MRITKEELVDILHYESKDYWRVRLVRADDNKDFMELDRVCMWLIFCNLEDETALLAVEYVQPVGEHGQDSIIDQLDDEGYEVFKVKPVTRQVTVYEEIEQDTQ